jgi:hypothetical protein
MQLFIIGTEAWQIRTLISVEIVGLEMLKLVSFSVWGHGPPRCSMFMIVSASIIRSCAVQGLQKWHERGKQHVSILSYTVLQSFVFVSKVIYNYYFRGSSKGISCITLTREWMWRHGYPSSDCYREAKPNFLPPFFSQANLNAGTGYQSWSCCAVPLSAVAHRPGL